MGTHYGIRPQGNNSFVKGRILYYDFIRNVYADTIGNRRTFEEAINFSRASNATMVDSDGLIKWAPHNLWRNSENITSARNGTITEIGTLNNAKTYRLVATSDDAALKTSIFVNAGETWTIEIWLRSPSGSLNTKISLGSRFPNGSGGRDVPVTATSEWQKFTVTATAISTGNSTFHPVGGYNGLLDGDIIELSAPRVYRSDLGGMVDNPNPLDPIDPTYVPTTNGSRYLPRIGHHYYDGIKYTNGGLLLENRSSTNEFTYSQDFTNSMWTKAQVSVSANQAIAPDGTNTATKLIENTATNVHTLYTFDGSGVRSTSVFVKAAERGFVSITAAENFSPKVYGVTVNLSNGEIEQTFTNNGATGTSSVEDYGNGWWRIGLNANVSSTGLVISIATNGTFTPNDFGNQSYSGDGSSGIYIWGAQLEESPCPTSYIPTNGSTATRAVETAELDDAIYETIFDQVGGTTLMDVRIPSYTQCTLWKCISRNTHLAYDFRDELNTINCRIDGTPTSPTVTTNRFDFPDLPISTDIFDLQTGFRFSPTLGVQTAGNGLTSIIEDGGVETIDFNGFTRIYLGLDPSTASASEGFGATYAGMRGIIRSVRMYDRPITESEIIQETTL